MGIWLVIHGTFNEGYLVWSAYDTKEYAIRERDALSQSIPGNWSFNVDEERWETMSEYLSIEECRLHINNASQILEHHQ